MSDERAGGATEGGGTRIASEVTEGVRSVIGAAEAVAAAITREAEEQAATRIRDAEEHADARMREADVEAARRLEVADGKAELLLAEHRRRLGDLAGSILERAQGVLRELEAASRTRERLDGRGAHSSR